MGYQNRGNREFFYGFGILPKKKRWENPYFTYFPKGDVLKPWKDPYFAGLYLNRINKYWPPK